MVSYQLCVCVYVVFFMLEVFFNLILFGILGLVHNSVLDLWKQTFNSKKQILVFFLEILACFLLDPSLLKDSVYAWSLLP